MGKKIVVALFVLAFVGGGINHFANPGFYLMLTKYIVPPGNLELEKQLIMVSGITEIIAGLLFALPRTRKPGATFIMLHLLAFVPIHVAMCFVTVEGADPNIQYIAWPRLAFQYVLIYWIAQFRMEK